MFGNPSLVARVAIAKGIGFSFGLIGLLSIPYFLPEAGWHLRIGILLWYTTFGAIIGLVGVFNRCPLTDLSMPWWLRGAIVGGWLNFVLTFFAYQDMQAMLLAVFGNNGVISSPFWFVLEGVLVGMLIDFFATKFAGEGEQASPQ